MEAKYGLIRINNQACFIKSHSLGQIVALVVYSESNKQWVVEFLREGPYSAELLMILAKFTHKQNKVDGYALAT